MFDLKTLFRFLDSGYILRIFFLCLLASLVPLAEIGLFFFLGEQVGMFLLLGVACIFSFAGLLTAFWVCTKILGLIRGEMKEGVMPEKMLYQLLGAFGAGVLLIFPGFITGFLGLLLLLPWFRGKLGRSLIRKKGLRLKEFYEYVKFYNV